MTENKPGHTNDGAPEMLLTEPEGQTTSARAFFEIQILTVREVADLLKLSTKTIYKRVRRGEIPHKKIGDEIRFLLPELIGWMKGDITYV